MNGDADHILPLDTVRNQYFRLFVCGQGSVVSWSTSERPLSLDGFGEQSLERIGSGAHQSPVFSRRIARTEFRTGVPKIMRSYHKYDPILEQPLLISGSSEIPRIRILD